MLYFEILFVLSLMFVNGLLAMSELAVVSSRKSRLGKMAGDGSAGARIALRLIDDPSRFLSTVQIGITLVGILAGAFGGATLADRLGDWFNTFAFVAPHGDTVAIGMVVAAITYLSLVVGELVPKRIALANPERVASLVARPMDRLSRVAAPAVWLLKASTDAILRLLKPSTRRATVTEDEVRSLIAEGVRSGIFMPQERELIDGVLRLADRPIRHLMTPRSAVVWIDAAVDRDTLARVVEKNRFSRLLVCERSLDRAVGVIHTKDLLPLALRDEPIDVTTLMAPAPVVPDSVSALQLIDRFRRERVHMAVVVDEYGVTEGIATPVDVLETIAGELPERGEALEPRITRRDDGSWIVDGMLPIDELEECLGMRDLHEGGDFYTVAGLVLQRLGRLPSAGETLQHRGARFEVLDIDGHRIDKVLVQRVA